MTRCQGALKAPWLLVKPESEKPASRLTVTGSVWLVPSGTLPKSAIEGANDAALAIAGSASQTPTATASTPVAFATLPMTLLPGSTEADHSQTRSGLSMAG